MTFTKKQREQAENELNSMTWIDKLEKFKELESKGLIIMKWNDEIMDWDVSLTDKGLKEAVKLRKQSEAKR